MAGLGGWVAGWRGVDDVVASGIPVHVPMGPCRNDSTECTGCTCKVGRRSLKTTVLQPCFLHVVTVC